MRVALHALGIGPGADPDVVKAVAQSAEAAGFDRLWAGEHTVMVDRGDSRYPYAADGHIAVPSDADWLDPFAVLGFAAAVTSTIELATGVMLLAEHNPVIVAKQAASLDVLSRGRFALGVGIGWSRAEFEALGVPFAGRAGRVAEYIEAMRALWGADVSSYRGGLVRFDDVRSYPKPFRHGRVPIILGGNSDPALDRVAEYADGWYGFNVAADDLPDRLLALRRFCEVRRRALSSLQIAVAITGRQLGRAELTDLGVTEPVLVETPPDEPSAVESWIAGLAAGTPLANRARRTLPDP